MNRDALRPALLALVCAVAIVLSAATLTSTVQTGGSGFGAGEGSGIGADEGDDLDTADRGNESGILPERRDRSAGPMIQPPCVHWLTEPWAVLSIVGVFLGIGLFVRQRVDAFAAVGLVATMAIPTVLVYALLTTCSTGESEQGSLFDSLTGNSSGGGGPIGISGPSIPNSPVDFPVAALVLVAAALVGILAVVFSDREALSEALGPVWLGAQDDEPAGDPEPAGRRLAVGRAAGRAADRLEADADLENEVYRAWVEMTRHLDVSHPESSTPAEFATAAVEAGFDRADVDELTLLFEGVRYGGQEATAERERRAIEALRRIEAAADGDGT